MCIRDRHLGHALGQGAQGRGEQPHIEDERNNDAEGDLSAHGQGGTQDADRHIAQVADDSHQGLHDAGEEDVYKRQLLNSGKLKGFRNGRVWRIPKLAIKEYILESARIKVKEERVR